ncbi:hypothetical protein ACFY00_33980 [Kitasatospora sp. NPDC001540]|uniref:hypothetical protein n=1 Tax=Kitasatospora sp. NPDC001540 TaxID=3364014 RepID=UPI00369B7263
MVPLRLRGTASRTIALERATDAWGSVDDQLAVFMPLRGSMDDARRALDLTRDGNVTLQVHQDQNADAALPSGILNTPDGRKTYETDVIGHGPDTADPAADRFVLHRPRHPITVTWEQPPCTRPDPPPSASRWCPGSGPPTCP